MLERLVSAVAREGYPVVYTQKHMGRNVIPRNIIHENIIPKNVISYLKTNTPLDIFQLSYTFFYKNNLS